MAISNPPKYRYLLSDSWDKEVFDLIKKLKKKGEYPRIHGTKEDINKFLVMLIRTQKSLHDWKEPLKEIVSQIKNSNKIDTESFNRKYPLESISHDVPEWVTYEDDKIVSDFIDELESRRIDFIGSNQEVSEFILRFIIGQLAHDWESTILMIWEMLGKGDTLSVKELNEEMKNFDYAKVFY